MSDSSDLAPPASQISYYNPYVGVTAQNMNSNYRKQLQNGGDNRYNKINDKMDNEIIIERYRDLRQQQKDFLHKINMSAKLKQEIFGIADTREIKRPDENQKLVTLLDPFKGRLIMKERAWLEIEKEMNADKIKNQKEALLSVQLEAQKKQERKREQERRFKQKTKSKPKHKSKSKAKAKFRTENNAEEQTSEPEEKEKEKQKEKFNFNFLEAFLPKKKNQKQEQEDVEVKKQKEKQKAKSKKKHFSEESQEQRTPNTQSKMKKRDRKEKVEEIEERKYQRNKYNLEIGDSSEMAESEIHVTKKNQLKKQLEQVSNVPPNAIPRPTFYVESANKPNMRREGREEDTIPKNKGKRDDKFRQQIYSQISQIPKRDSSEQLSSSNPSLQINQESEQQILRQRSNTKLNSKGSRMR